MAGYRAIKHEDEKYLNMEKCTPKGFGQVGLVGGGDRGSSSDALGSGFEPSSISIFTTSIPRWAMGFL